ncbi:hypothetical protein ACHWQZ_G018294 [Mnemiopsis leidyi]
MSRLGMEHHMFLQTLAARRIVSEREAVELITKCIELAQVGANTQVQLQDHITKINSQLSALFLEIRKGTCENSGTKYYCFVNNQEDEISKLCSNYAPLDFAYFRKIIEQMILSDEGCVQSTDSLTLCNNLPDQKKMTYVHAKALLRGWKMAMDTKKLYRMFHDCYEEKTKVEDVIAFVRNNSTNVEQQTDIVDMFAVLDIESTTKEDVKDREIFIKVLESVTKHIKHDILKERLEYETLERIKLINNSKQFNTKYVRTRTKLFYKQQKFNLLREENEGYNKLMTELANPPSDPQTMIDHLLKLIGRFDLDPNRVLDLVLETWQNYLDKSEFFLQLVKLFPKQDDALCRMLGYSFAFHENEPEGTPETLFKVGALLIKRGLIDLHVLYSHLGPSYEVMKTEYNKLLSDAREKAKSLTTVSLNKDDGGESNDSKSGKQTEPTVSENQKVNLCIALIGLGCWLEADDLIQLIPPYSVPHNPKGREVMFDLISWRIHEFYKSKVSAAVTVRPVQEINNDPQVKCWEDLNDMVFTPLFRLGPYLSHCPVLFTKILRLFQLYIKENKADICSQALAGQMMTITSDVILPSLSMMNYNYNFTAMIWRYMQHFPYHIRYRLYAKWKNVSYAKNPLLMVTKAETIHTSRYILKRLTKENVKPFGRQIGRVAHCNPAVIFDQILFQIQRYDNLILPIVNALKYLGLLSLDVLSYCIIEALSDPEKSKQKEEDTNISWWFQVLAQFCGHVYKKYNIELSGLLQYIVNQLKANKSTDLLILKEVIQRMSGIEISEEVTESQLEAVCGGPVLLAEAGFFTPIRHTERSNQRLQESLGLNDIWLPLCVLASQQRHSIVFGNEERHIKLTARLYDQCQDTFTQLGQFLTTNPTNNQSLKTLPSFEELSTMYHLQADSAFFLLRTKLSDQIMVECGSTCSPDDPQPYITASDKIISQLSDQVKLLYPPKVWDKISPRLFATFWSLSSPDIILPSQRYTSEIDRIETAIKQVNENEDLAQRRKDKEIERHKDLITKLKEEQKSQEVNHKLVLARLEAEKDEWFTNANSTKVDAIMQFLQVCIIQRSMFTASDAIYCAKFVELCHKMQASNFSTLIYFDRIFSDVSHIVTNCTDNEASRYGRFLCETLKGISRWHKDKALYEKECGKSPGFVHIIRGDPNSDGAKRIEKYLDYENFRHVCCKWHFKLTKAMVFCFDSKDYSQIRNGLTVLNKILPEFPVVLNLAQALEKRILKVKEEEKKERPDLYALAMGYSAQLNSRRNTFIAEEKFHHVEKKTPETTAASRNSSPARKDKRAESVKRRDETESEKKRRREDDLKKEGERKSAEKKVKQDVSPKTKANGVRERDSETDENRSKIRKK